VEDSVFATVALPIALAVIMTVLGLALTPADFRRVVVFPRGVAIGLSNLIVISPLLAFAVAEAYALEPALAVGLVILGAAPGGTMANMLTHLARGDTASITLTAISSVAGLKAPAGTPSRSTPGGSRGARRDSSAGPRRRR
jgi:bile acid:Na+ symporter, BASS family